MTIEEAIYNPNFKRVNLVKKDHDSIYYWDVDFNAEYIGNGRYKTFNNEIINTKSYRFSITVNR